MLMAHAMILEDTVEFFIMGDGSYVPMIKIESMQTKHVWTTYWRLEKWLRVLGGGSYNGFSCLTKSDLVPPGKAI
jgi:hypothetical protein